MGKGLFPDLSGLSKTINDSIDAQKQASDEYQKSLIAHLGSIEYQLNNLSVLLKSINNKLSYESFYSNTEYDEISITELLRDIYKQ